jgi:hypothetical protein
MADDTRRTGAAAPDDDPLAWEARNAPRAAIAAGVAAVSGLLSTVVLGLANGAAPRSEARVLTLADTLKRAADGRPQPPGQLATLTEYQGNHPIPFIIGGLLSAVALLAAYPALAYLYRAVRARTALPPTALVLAAAGSVMAGVGAAISQIGLTLAAADFANGADHTNSAALDVQNNGVAVAGTFLGFIGGVILAVALLLIALNAMRAGLLSRLMGIVGMFAAATFVIRGLDPFGAIRAFWFAALAMLILGRLPRGRPPAWSVPEAVPWPTQQQLREQREAAARERGEPPARAPRRRGPAPAAADEDANGTPRGGRVPAPRAPQPRREDAAPGRPHPSSKKRKRKRRS